jgi:aryl-alcohol dehydrogenase-like predicted oxidoreductase
MRWILQSVPGSVVLAGIRSRSQAEENAKTSGWSLDAADIETLRTVDLSSADDRTPATYEAMTPFKVL